MITMFFVGILILISSCATAPKVVTPQMEFVPSAELEKRQANCTPFIDTTESAFLSGSELEKESSCLALVKCYRGNWKLWEYEYRVLEAQYHAVQGAHNGRRIPGAAE